jgi:DNA processing protein
MCDLPSPRRPALNRKLLKLHLYSRNLRSLRTKKIYSVLKADEAMHLDEIIEKLEPALSSSEIFASLFELELAGKVKQLPGENFVKSF